MNATQDLSVTETKKMVFLLLFCGRLLEKNIKTEYIYVLPYMSYYLLKICVKWQNIYSTYSVSCFQRMLALG